MRNYDKLTWLILGLMTFITPLMAQSGEASTLTVHIDNIQSVEGNIQLALFDSEENFPDGKPYKAIRQKVEKQGSMEVVFQDVPPGTYTLAIYQDENANGELDTNFMGIPKEPYGFSNNHRPGMSGPDFEAAKFQISESQQVLNVRID